MSFLIGIAIGVSIGAFAMAWWICGRNGLSAFEGYED